MKRKVFALILASTMLLSACSSNDGISRSDRDDDEDRGETTVVETEETNSFSELSNLSISEMTIDEVEQTFMDAIASIGGGQIDAVNWFANNVDFENPNNASLGFIDCRDHEYESFDTAYAFVIYETDGSVTYEIGDSIDLYYELYGESYYYNSVVTAVRGKYVLTLSEGFGTNIHWSAPYEFAAPQAVYDAFYAIGD